MISVTQLKKYVPIFIIICLALLIWILGLYRYINIETLKTHQEFIQLFVEKKLILAILIYAGLYILIVSLSIPGATFMTLVGGFLFGQWIGTAAVVISATIGASILFLSAKMASHDLLLKKTGSWVDKMKKGFQKNAFFYLLTLRLIPIFPFFVVNLMAAFFQISWRVFFWGTFLGIMPGSFIYVSAGVALRTLIQQPHFSPQVIVEPKILFALIGLGILSLLPVLYKYFRR